MISKNGSWIQRHVSGKRVFSRVLAAVVAVSVACPVSFAYAVDCAANNESGLTQRGTLVEDELLAVEQGEAIADTEYSAESNALSSQVVEGDDADASVLLASANDANSAALREIVLAQNTALCLDVEGGFSIEGTNVRLFASSEEASQSFIVEQIDDGFYFLKFAGTDMVVAPVSSSVFPGQNVVLRQGSRDDSSQLWAMRANSDGSVTFVLKDSGLVLSVEGSIYSGANLCVEEDCGSAGQKFVLNENWSFDEWAEAGATYGMDESGSLMRGCWVSDEAGWRYLSKETGEALVNSWVPDSSGMCYVGSDGYCEVGWFLAAEDLNGNATPGLDGAGVWYCSDKNGHLLVGVWAKDSCGWCYLTEENGQMLTSTWMMDSSGPCYVGAAGYCLTGWFRMATDCTGAKTPGTDGRGAWYHANADGSVETNKWVKDSSGWCYTDPATGEMWTNSWAKDWNGWCFLNGSGYCVTGTVEIDTDAGQEGNPGLGTFEFASNGVRMCDLYHIYVIAGHGAGDPGAVGNGHEEQERVRALAQRIKDYGGDYVTLHPFSDNAYASKALNTLDIPKNWQIVELHMDSSDYSYVRGGHVIINGRRAADSYDKALASLIIDMFPGRLEGIVKRTDLTNSNIAYSRGYSYRLVENGFISNTGDVWTFNARIDDLAKGYLTAFGIPIVGYGTWKSDANGWRFERSGGGYYRNCWQQLDGDWYLFDANGYALTGWQWNDGSWYYLAASPSCRMCCGWVLYGGKWYYLANSGRMVTGWQAYGGAWYWLKDDGSMAADESLLIKGTWYTFDASGKMM